MRRWIACFLTLLLCMAALPASAAEASAPSPWAENEVSEAISAGLVPEELRTDYQQDITREEFAHLAVQLCMVKFRYVGGPEQFVEDYRLYFHDREGNPAAAISAEFSDATTWGTAAAALGIVQGRGDGTFDPEGLITRQEAAAMVTRAYQAYSGQPELNIIGGGSAYENAPDWAAESIAWLEWWGFMKGDGKGDFMLQSHLTREQAILIFKRLSDWYTPTYGLVPYEEELSRTLFPEGGAFSLTEMVEESNNAGVLGIEADGTPSFWIVYGSGGRTQLWPILEELVPGMTGVEDLSVVNGTDLTFYVKAEDGARLFRLSFSCKTAGEMREVLTPQPALDGIGVTGFDGTHVFAAAEDGVAVYDMTGQKMFDLPPGTITWDGDTGIFRHDSADGVMYYTSEGQPLGQTPWFAATDFHIGQAVVQGEAGGSVSVIDSSGKVLSTLDSFGGTIADPTYDGGYGGDYVLLDKDGRHYLLNTTDGSLFGGEYLDVGPFEGTYIPVKTEEGWGFLDQFFQIAVSCQYLKVYPFRNMMAVVQQRDGTFSSVDTHGRDGTLGSSWTFLSGLNGQGRTLGIRPDEEGIPQTMLVSEFQLPVPLPGDITEYVLYGATAVRTADGKITLFGMSGTETLARLDLEGVWGTADGDIVLLKSDGRYYLYDPFG
ncbi:S-layer homology domain-containing protein [uncultured Pseudoflavonifractor sp.]|uniref:S-layer homology domain-containing protein n=1 Tax=uncultured Pseudoflavonifractor sp. TaxID=1221379 RepID=UPI0026004B4A|nr:S-layer homology domain-containing protein [uncultured Pseudoflavonifractor sp.]